MQIIGFIGDSITEQSYTTLSAADGWVYKLLERLAPGKEITSSNIPVYSGGTLGWLNTHSTTHWVFLNRGVSGNNTGSMKVRFGADILAFPVDRVVFLAGFIDCSTQDIETFTKPNMLDMWARCQARGIDIIIALTTPRTGATQTLLDTDISYRAWLRSQAEANNWPIWDFCTPLEATPGIGVGSPTYYTIDNAHPNAAGCMSMANAANLTDLGEEGERGGMFVIQSGIDSYIHSAVPTTNYGTATTSQIGDDSTSASRATNLLTKFTGLNTTLPTGAIARDTIFSLWEWATNYTGVTTTDVALRQLLRPWTSTGVTFNTYDGTNTWTTPGALGDGIDRSANALATLTMDATIGGFGTGDFVFWRGAELDAYITAINHGTPDYGLLIESTGNYIGTTTRAANYFYTFDRATASLRPKIAGRYILPFVPQIAII